MSKDFVPYLNITARFDGKPEDDMLSKKGGRGFPYCIVMDQEGKILTEARPSEEAAFSKAIRPATLLMDARKAVAKKSSKKAKRNLALMEAVIEPTEEKLKALMKTAKKKGLNKEIQALFMATVATWPVRQVVDEADAAAKGGNRDQAEKDSQKKMYALYKKKVSVDDSDSKYFVPFWMGIANHSVEIKDKKTGMKAIVKLEKKFEGNSRALNYFKKIRDKLEAL